MRAPTKLLVERGPTALQTVLISALFACGITGACAVYDPALIRMRDTSIEAADDTVVPDGDDVPLDTAPDDGCGPGQTRCGTSCVSTRTDLMHCGACGMACASRPNATAACNAGVCEYTCQTGFDDCDRAAANGCESRLASDTAHCGNCATACRGATNAAAICDMGVCRQQCLTGFADCDGNTANGCESALDSPMSCGSCRTVCAGATPLCSIMGSVGTCTSGCPAGQTRCGSACVDVRTDPNNCAGCGNRCPTATNATPSCAAGVCGITCTTGFGNCDATSANGCETDLNTTVNCGACGTRCSSSGIPFTTAVCTARVCGTTCTTGRGDCDGNVANGCETSIDAPQACGMCGRRCTTAQSCAGRVCCAFPLSACPPSTACIDLNSDAMNCGRCGTVCGAATPTCCQGTCIAGTSCTGRYAAASSTVAFIDVCGSTHREVLPLTDDASRQIPETTGTPLITIPFTVRHYGAVMPVPFTVSTNGWLSLTNTTSASLGGTIPSPTVPNSVLAPMWTDLYTRSRGICYGIVGAAPSRRFVVQWADVHYCCTDDPTVHLEFEVIINEAAGTASNTIDFVYRRLDGMTRAGTVGVENATGTAGTAVGGWISAVSSIRFTYVP